MACNFNDVHVINLIEAGYINILPNKTFMIKIEEFWLSTAE